MTRYFVALAVGGLMEHPEIEYRDVQEIEAPSEKEAVRIYNEKNRCSFFYGQVISAAKAREIQSKPMGWQ